MSAAIQLVNQSVVLPAESIIGTPLNNVSRFESAPEQRLRRALEYVSQLQAEVGALREELARAERSASHYEVLLRNAMTREQELRRQVAGGII